MDFRFLILLAGSFLSSPVWADLTPEQARNIGLILYNQHMGISAVKPLRIAAKAGDASAQYYLGETLRLKENGGKRGQIYFLTMYMVD